MSTSSTRSTAGTSIGGRTSTVRSRRCAPRPTGSWSRPACRRSRSTPRRSWTGSPTRRRGTPTSRRGAGGAGRGRAAMPVPGLGFGEGSVTFDGVPFDQAETSAQIRVGVAIAMAANPKLRVIRIKEGSFLDQDNLALIAEMARAHDYKVWLERVDTSGKVGVVIDDGQVVAVNGEPVATDGGDA